MKPATRGTCASRLSAIRTDQSNGASKHESQPCHCSPALDPCQDDQEPDPNAIAAAWEPRMRQRLRSNGSIGSDPAFSRVPSSSFLRRVTPDRVISLALTNFIGIWFAAASVDCGGQQRMPTCRRCLEETF